MKRPICVFLVIFILVSAIFSGCAPTRKPLQDQAKNAAPTQSAKLPPPTPRAPKELSRNDPTTSIEQKLDALPNVRESAVVFSGDTAYVGLYLYNGENSGTTESTATSLTKSSGPFINNVYVTTEPQKVARLKNIQNARRAGRPITNFTKDLSDITEGKFTP